MPIPLSPCAYFIFYAVNIILSLLYCLIALLNFICNFKKLKKKPNIQISNFWTIIFFLTTLNFLSSIVSLSEEPMIIPVLGFFYWMSTDSCHICFLLILINAGVMVSFVLERTSSVALSNKRIQYKNLTENKMYILAIFPCVIYISWSVCKYLSKIKVMESNSPALKYLTIFRFAGHVYNLFYGSIIILWLCYKFNKLFSFINEDDLIKDKYALKVREWKLFLILVVLTHILFWSLVAFKVLDFLFNEDLHARDVSKLREKYSIEILEGFCILLKHLGSTVILIYSPAMNNFKSNEKNTHKNL